MIYTSEILNQALQELGSNDIKERKKASSLFMRAACKELGTKDTGTIKEWFVLNGEKYLLAIKSRNRPRNYLDEYLHASEFLCKIHKAESSL